jgi:two-component system, chemotaxis family, CheB/CheR fusion protein
MTEVDSESSFDTLLTYLRDHRGFDFTGYKRASLGRRIAKRTQLVGVADFHLYQEYLESNPGEFAELFNTILINVTEFLRDRESWDYLATLLPEITDRDSSEQIRVWSAGCASGEEAVSVAVLLAETVGEDRFRRVVKIYATDVDDEALTVARHARYPERALLQAFGPERATRFFELDGGFGTFRRDLRNSLIFGRHDLMQDPPISRIDLLVCRNTLMYFTAEAQRRILTAFQFALAKGGYLFLGTSEALVGRTQLFQTVDLHHHVFRKDGDERRSYSAAGMPRTYTRAVEPAGGLAETAFELSPTAQLVVDRLGNLTMANRHARALFGLGLSQIGRPVRELDLSRRLTELKAALDSVFQDRRAYTATDAVLELPNGETVYLDTNIVPLVGPSGVIGATVAFTEVGRFRVLREQLERSQAELGSAYEELQSTVEELETTNEELHSTNEELETMNEELQSTNEELETINNELRVRTGQLDEANQFLQSVLSSLQSAVIVVNPDLQVKEWSRQAEELWGLRFDEVENQNFLNLDIGLPVDQLRVPVRAVMSGRANREELSVAAVNRRGRSVQCSVSLTPLLAEETVIGAIMVMDTVPAETSR